MASIDCNGPPDLPIFVVDWLFADTYVNWVREINNPEMPVGSIILLSRNICQVSNAAVLYTPDIIMEKLKSTYRDKGLIISLFTEVVRVGNMPGDVNEMNAIIKLASLLAIGERQTYVLSDDPEINGYCKKMRELSIVTSNNALKILQDYDKSHTV